jgi:DNA repair protein RadC
VSRALRVEPDLLDDPELAEACRIVQAARQLSETAIVEDLSRTVVGPNDGRLVAYLRSILAGSDEMVIAVFLDNQCRYLRHERLSLGLGGQVTLRARPLFARAFELAATRLIVAHNHPSGDCRPSLADIQATKELVSAGRMLDVELIDHLIIADRSYFSFSAGGLL